MPVPVPVPVVVPALVPVPAVVLVTGEVDAPVDGNPPVVVVPVVFVVGVLLFAIKFAIISLAVVPVDEVSPVVLSLLTALVPVSPDVLVSVEPVLVVGKYFAISFGSLETVTEPVGVVVEGKYPTLLLAAD